MCKMRSEIETMAERALKKLYKKDKYLIAHNAHDLSGGIDEHVSERGIVTRFAMYLQEQLYSYPALCRYNIDVEYNRNMDKPKYLPCTKWKNNGAYPDLIIHKRGCNGSENNILIIEFKTHWNRSTEAISDDIDKLQAFQKEPYFYRNAMFIKLMQHSPEGYWVSEGTTIDDLTEASNVFKDFRVSQRGGNCNE